MFDTYFVVDMKRPVLINSVQAFFNVIDIMTAVSEQTTKMSIQVGTFVSESKSHRIYQTKYNNINPIE